jgi:hypothetical protein
MKFRKNVRRSIFFDDPSRRTTENLRHVTFKRLKLLVQHIKSDRDAMQLLK